MSRLVKHIFIRLGIAAAVFLAPVFWCAFGTQGYFEGVRYWCHCPNYYFFRNNTLYTLTPGEGNWGRPIYSLKPVADGWEARSILPTPNVAPVANDAFLVMTNDQRANGNRPHLRLRMQGGDLYELWGNGTNWVRHARIYNVWSVWWQQFFPPPSEKKAQHINCVNNLKQIGLAFRIWSGDNQDQYPFNLGTNAGGTREWCVVGKDGFDRNAFRHFQVMSNELSTPKLLICPQDHSKRAATHWASLGPENVTYRLRTGTNVCDTNPHEILAVCPVDGNILYCDGTVQSAKQDEPTETSNFLNVKLP